MSRSVIDSHFKAVLEIDPAYWSASEGFRFKASYLQEHGSELANDATVVFLMRIGARHLHVVPRIAVGGDCDLLMYEGPTVSAAGTPVSVIAKNRVDSITSLTTVFHTPTTSANGDLLFNWYVEGGSKKGAGRAWSEALWVLAANEDYLFKITNRSGGAIQFSFSLGWIEE